MSMSTLTYTGIITTINSSGVSRYVLYTNPGSQPEISVTFQAPNSELLPMSLTLQNIIDVNTTTATVVATFLAPSWTLGSHLPKVTPVISIIPFPGAAWMTVPVQAVVLTTNVANAAASAIASSPFVSTYTSVATGVSVVESSLSSTSVSSGGNLAATTSVGHTSHKTSSDVSTGTLAGAAVGCLLAGLLIASLATWLYLRRRSESKRGTHNGERSLMDEDMSPHGVTIVNGGLSKWEKQLPQADSDKTIKQLASRTLDEIELFVEEYYSNKSVSAAELNVCSELKDLSSKHLSRSLGELLAVSPNPAVLMKHTIANYLIQKIDPSCDGADSLLPKGFRAPNLSSMSQPSSRQAVSQIRRLTAYAHPDPLQDTQYLEQCNRVAEELGRQIETAFRPWVRGNHSQRTKSLRGIVLHVGELGVKLFSQPASFEWQWDQTSQPKSRKSKRDTAEIVMLPGLDKTTDQRAELLASPICLVQIRWGSWA